MGENQEKNKRILFSVCLITRNESKTLPKLIQSLKEFQSLGGEICLLDTGSTDNTADLARSLGCIVEEVGTKYLHTINKELADLINARFTVDDEAPVVKEGDTYFDFASARNHASSLASNNMVSFADADEVFTRMDIDKVNSFIKSGITQFEYNFVFSHDQYGNELTKFIQSKFYDKSKMKWVGVIHEHLDGLSTRQFLDESVFKLEHWQNQETNRSGYLRGLAVDCFNNPANDRNSHYFAREMFWCNRPKSAIKEFNRHIEMNRWPAERAQSMIFSGDCYGVLNQPEKQVECYTRAFHTDSSRREPLMKLARFYQSKNNYQAAASYASGALEIPWNAYYANNHNHYTNEPHEILYWAKGWMGDIKGAQEHILKALHYQPNNAMYLRDTKYYFNYPAPDINGWMTYEELLWLNETAKKYNSILELGSWEGRSTHALATGCKGHLTCVDTWNGSKDSVDLTSWMAKEKDVFQCFLNNTKQFRNITPIRKSGMEASKDFLDKSFECVFIDAGHSYEEVKADIKAWLPKATKILCGHDYLQSWMGVIQAVDEAFGKPDGVCGTIWWIDLEKRGINQEGITGSKGEPGEPGFRIPKRIFTIWLSEDKVIPPLVQKCIDSQKIPGYEHRLITLDNCFKDSEYMKQCLNSPYKKQKWCKASDYLRMHYLYTEGGIYLDADVEVLPDKNFDNLLSNRMFGARENNGFIGAAVIGAEKGYLFIKHWIDKVTQDFRGDDNKNFESSMDILVRGYFEYNWPKDGFALVPTETFFPYDHQSGTTNITDKTVCIHHFMKTWVEPPPVKDLLFTGERLVLGKVPDNYTIVIEHVQRYNFAKQFTEGLVILDASCGSGYGKDILKAKEYYGIDIDPETIAYASSKYGPGFSLENLEKGISLNIKPDITVSFETIEHLENPDKFLTWVRDNSKSFIFSIPVNMPSEFHKQVYSIAQIKDLISKYFKTTLFFSQSAGIEELIDSADYVVGIAFPEKLPTVSIIIPTLGREEGLKRCMESIHNLIYPKDLIEIVINEDSPRIGVPKRLKEGVEDSDGEFIVFGSNDIEFTPASLLNIVLDCISNKRLFAAFNTGTVLEDKGNICEHFIIKRTCIPLLENNEIFCTEFNHVGTDNYLWAQFEKLGYDHRSENAVVKHYHFTNGAEFDETYRIGWKDVDADRTLLKKKLEILNL